MTFVSLTRLPSFLFMASITLAARAYQKSFDVRPYTTLAVTNGTLSAIGDAVAQGAQIFVSLSSNTR